jgi:hypothetical protein
MVTGPDSACIYDLHTLQAIPRPGTEVRQRHGRYQDYEVFCRNYGLQGIGCFENHNGWSDLTQFDPPGLRMPSSFACNFDSGKSFYNQVGWGETITYAAQVGGDNSVWGLKDDGTRASPTQNQELWPVCALAH